MWYNQDPVQIWTNKKDLVVILPNQGSYVFRNYFIENMSIEITRDTIDYTNLALDTYKVLRPGPSTAHLDLRITGIPESSTDWRPVDAIEQLSILELFKVIENRIDQRTEQEKN